MKRASVLATLSAHERSLEAALLVSMGVVPSAVGLPVQRRRAGDGPAGAILSERGVTMSSLRHCGLAGRSHGPYENNSLDGECLL